MSAQIHELGKEQRAGHTSNRYNLRSRRKEGDFDSSDQPLIADRPTKVAAAIIHKFGHCDDVMMIS
jgi:hypothetical protein